MRRLCVLPLLLAACTATPTQSVDQPVVYGNDDRQDVYAFADQTWAARAAEVSPAMIDTTDIDATDPSNVVIAHGTLSGSFGVCADERFASQPTAAGCSASLIAPDLILTAGHCVTATSCAHTSYVFDYTMTDATTLHTITADDVYACQQVVVRQVAASDYAVVRLDRAVVGRTPATVRLDPSALATTTPLIVQGFPSTIPLKIDDGGAVRDGRPDALDYFVANLDTFGGNSGSGVYLDTGELAGILVRGETDYVMDGTCYRVNQCPDDGCGGEESTYVFRAIDALCAVAPTPGLCACGDGTCDAAGGETTATCSLDCGSVCGDGACNGTESPLDCTDDCGFCGNGACDQGETEATCCDDCACTVTDQVCHAHSCIPDPAIGDSCASATTLTPTGTQVIDDSTDLAVDDLAGSCVGAGANDRVYTFTTTVETALDAHVTGFDTGIYLESICGDSSTELACNDDLHAPDDLTSQITATLPAGTYSLIVDGYTDEAGAYQLTVIFTPLAGPDAGAEPDAGTPETGDGGGCCSTGGGGAGGSLLLLLVVVSSWSRRARSSRWSRLRAR